MVISADMSMSQGATCCIQLCVRHVDLQLLDRKQLMRENSFSFSARVSVIGSDTVVDTVAHLESGASISGKKIQARVETAKPEGPRPGRGAGTGKGWVWAGVRGGGGWEAGEG